MGQCSVVDVTPKLCIGNLYAQLSRRDKASVHSLSDALTKFIRQNHPTQIHTYKLGCEMLSYSGDRLDWSTEVCPMMERLGQRYKCSFIVWETGKSPRLHREAASGTAKPGVSPVGVERMQIMPLGRTTVRPGPQTFGRAPVRPTGGKQQQARSSKASRARPAARQKPRQKPRQSAKPKPKTTKQGGGTAVVATESCMHLRPELGPGVRIVDDSFAETQAARGGFGRPAGYYGITNPQNNPQNPRQLTDDASGTRVAANVQSSIAQRVADHVRTELDSGDSMGSAAMEQLATSVMREEVAKLFQLAPSAAGAAAAAAAAGNPGVPAPSTLHGVLEATATLGVDESSSFDGRVRDLMLAVIGSNPANLEGLPPSVVSGGFEGFDPVCLPREKRLLLTALNRLLSAISLFFRSSLSQLQVLCRSSTERDARCATPGVPE